MSKGPLFKLTSLRYCERVDAEHDLWLQRQFWGDEIQTISIQPQGSSFVIVTFLRNHGEF